jgi:hypothetical protein
METVQEADAAQLAAQSADTVQTNVRVAESDKPLIVQVAQRLRRDPGFRDKLVALLDEHAYIGVEDRIKKLEQQVSWLLSGAIVVPRAPARLGQAASVAAAAKPPITGPRRTGA